MSVDPTCVCGPMRNVLEDNHVPAKGRYSNALVEDSMGGNYYLYDAWGVFVQLPSDFTPSTFVSSWNGQTGVITATQDELPDGTNFKQFSAANKTKLAGIEAGAQVNTVSSVNDQVGDIIIGGTTINVKAYGALGDGTADDTSAIQAAINAAAALPTGATVLFPAGTYISTAITLKNKVNLEGEGVGKTIIKLKANSNSDLIITDNFYNDIFTNYNSYSTVGHFKISEMTLDGAGDVQSVRTHPYDTQGSFPATGVAGHLYVAMDQDNNFGVGYLWNGSAYTTTGIKNSGKHWRAYAKHILKVYAYAYVLENVLLNNGREFMIYSEQTNTDTTVFNDFDTMEARLERVTYLGYGIGGINWYGPHDSAWTDVKGHTNHFYTSDVGGSNEVLYNIFIDQTANTNAAGLVWQDVHPWGGTASFGNNVLMRNGVVRGTCYIEGSVNQGLYATDSQLNLEFVGTNNAINMRLNNMRDTHIKYISYYNFQATGTFIQLEGTQKNCSYEVLNVDLNNVGVGTKIFDITNLTTYSQLSLKARIPYHATAIDPGVTATSLNDTCEIDIVKMTSTTVAAITRRFPGFGTASQGHVIKADASGNPTWSALFVAAPASASATGVAGSVAFDTSYVYVCVATNTWMRAAIATW